MPKTLSPTPYVHSGAGSMAYTVKRANLSGCVSPSASPVTVSALSHYSSSTAGLLDELQIYSLDTPGASPTPSPTLSHVSAYTSTAGLDDALTASTAAAATFTNVIISATLRVMTNIRNFLLSLLILMTEANLHFSDTRVSPVTNSPLQLTFQTCEGMSAHFYSFVMLMCLLVISVLLCLFLFVSWVWIALLLVIILSLQGQLKKIIKLVSLIKNKIITSEWWEEPFRLGILTLNTIHNKGSILKPGKENLIYTQFCAPNWTRQIL